MVRAVRAAAPGGDTGYRYRGVTYRGESIVSRKSDRSRRGVVVAAAACASRTHASTPQQQNHPLKTTTVGQAVLVNPADDDKSLVYVSR